MCMAWLSAGCVATNESRCQTPADKAFRVLPIGICEDYPEESRSIAAARRDLEVAATNGLRVLRIAFGWDAMEPERGQYDWSFWDQFVRMATEEFHIRLIPYVCYTPRWASTSNEDDFWQHPPRDSEDFARFMRALVERYKTRIHSWELWNEPDNPAYWAGSVEQFAGLLTAGARAVRQTDPNAKVVFGGLAWDLNFLESVLTNGEAMEHVDVVNLHNYYETWSSEPLEYLPGYVGRARDILRQHGLDQPIWMAEVGYSSFRRGAHVSGQYRAQYGYEHTDNFQAAALFRMLTMLAAMDDVSLIAWYRINDLPQTQEVIGDVNNRHLGVLDEQGGAKPAMHALRFFASLFGQGFRCIDHEVRVTAAVRPKFHAHAFELRDGRVVLVSWLQNHVYGQWRPGDGSTDNPRRGFVSVQLPFGVSGSASAFNAAGEPVRATLARSATGSRVEMNVAASETTIVLLRRAHR